MSIANRLRSPDQTKAIGSEESDEHLLLGDLIRFVENSDQSIPRIAELMGVSGVALSMWIAGTARPTAIKLLEIKNFLKEPRHPKAQILCNVFKRLPSRTMPKSATKVSIGPSSRHDCDDGIRSSAQRREPRPLAGWMRCFSHRSETALPSTRCSRRIATFCSGLKKRRLLSFIEACSFRPRVA
jgi:hypothetical protein